MKITLFDAAQQVRESMQVDPETGEISEAFAESRELFEQKGSPKISPFRKSKEIPLTACTVRDLLMGKCCL